MECRLEQRTGLLTLQYSRDNVFLWGKGQAGLLPIIKDVGSLSLGLSCDTKPLCAQHPPESLKAIRVGIEAQGPQTKTCRCLCQKESGPLSPSLLHGNEDFTGVSCLLPVSVNLWQTCKEGNSSEPSEFLASVPVTLSSGYMFHRWLSLLLMRCCSFSVVIWALWRMD